MEAALMKAMAFIPARGSSKRVPGKNLCEVGGESLLERAIASAYGLATPAAQLPGGSDWDVVVSSDAASVRNIAREEGVSIHERPPQLASDHAQIEDAIAHWWTRLDDKPDVIVLLQPTSPFRTAAHVREALRLLEATDADSVVGVTVGHEPHFAGRLKPRTDVVGPFGDIGRPFTDADAWFDWQPFSPYGVADRPRTQDLAPRGWENGALYVTRRAAWEKSGARTSGYTVALPMSKIEGWDIDTAEDLAIANAMVAAGVAQ